MKALQSKLAAELLADPKTAIELRRFMTGQNPHTFDYKRGDKVVQVTAQFIPRPRR